jgi:hypothetical protein
MKFYVTFEYRDVYCDLLSMAFHLLSFELLRCLCINIQFFDRQLLVMVSTHVDLKYFIELI